MKTLEEIENDKNLEFEKQLEEILSKRKNTTPNKTAKEAYKEALKSINIKENANLFLDNKLNDVFYQYLFSLKVKLDKESRALLVKDLCAKLNCSTGDIINKLYDIVGYCDDNELLYGFALGLSLKVNLSINETFLLKNIQKAILESDKCKYVYSFARDIPGVDYEAFIKKLESKPKFIDKANKLRKLAYKRTGNKMFLTNERVAKNPSKSALDAYKEALMGINVKENQQIVIDDNSDYLIYSFAKDVEGADIKLLQSAIIENEDFHFTIRFFNDVKGCDISKLEDSLIKSKNNDAIYTFACNIPKANIKRLGQAIIESNDAYDNYIFAKDIPGADIKAHIEVLKKHNCLDKIKELEEKLNSQKPKKTNQEATEEAKQGINVKENEQIILAFNNAEYSYLFARDVKGADVKAHEKVILDSTNTFDLFHAYIFARDIKGANIKALEEKILSSFSTHSDYAQVCFSFAKDIKNANIKALEENILKTGNAQWSGMFAYYIPGANIKEHEKLVLKSTDWEVLFHFAKNVPGADIQAIENIILAKNDPFCSYNFAKYIPGANIEEHLEVLEKHPEYFSKIIELENALLLRNKMNTKTSWLKQNAQEGIYQGIAASAINNLSISLIKLLESLNVDEVSIKIFKDFIETDLGKSALSALIGAGIHLAPNDKIKNNTHIQKVADKCIQNASSKGIEHGANLAMNFILPALLNAVNTPQAKSLELLSSKLRVNPIDDQIEDEIFESANEVDSLRK